MPQQPGDIETALAGKTTVVAAPLQDVHREQRGVGELEEEDLLAGEVLDALGIGTAREDVKAVEAGAERGVVGLLDDAPGMVVRTDMATPRQRFVRHPHAELLRQFGELTQLPGGKHIVVHGKRRHTGTHQHGVGPEPPHELKLTLGPPQVARELVLRHGLDIAHRLIEVDAQTEVGAPVADLLGREGTGEEIVLKDLDTVEPGPSGSSELLGEGATEGDGGDGCTHGGAPSRRRFRQRPF